MEDKNLSDPISTAEIENFLKRRLGDKEGEEVMQYIHEEIDKNVEARVGDVQQEVALWRTHLKDEFASKQDAEDLKKRLIKRVSAVEGTIILWGFVFWATIILAFYLINRFVQ